MLFAFLAEVALVKLRQAMPEIATKPAGRTDFTGVIVAQLPRYSH